MEATSDVSKVLIDKSPKGDVNSNENLDVNSQAIPQEKVELDVNSHETTSNVISHAIPDANATSILNPQVVPDVKENQIVQVTKENPYVNLEPTSDMNFKTISNEMETINLNSQEIPDIKENSQVSQGAMAITPDLNPPTKNDKHSPERIEEQKEAGPSFHCNFCDTDLVHKVAQAFFPGLATACIDYTTGDVFKSAGSIAADVRKEMVDYLNNRGENFVAESVVLEGGPEAEVSDHPFDILTEFIDDFAATKRNLLSRVSGWLLSDKREEKIDDLVQEMGLTGFWPLETREQIAQKLIREVDFRTQFSCDMKFSSSEELEAHVSACGFRSVGCLNDGCSAKFSSNQAEKHDSMCPFKIIPCEQGCGVTIMRREMDRHCITVCPMKLVNCPFFPVGCQSSVPHCRTGEHCSEYLRAHLLCILKGIHKQVPEEDLMQRVNQLEQSSLDQLVKGQAVLRSLSSTVKDLDAKLGLIEVTPRDQVADESLESIGENDEKSVDSTNKTNQEVVEPIVDSIMKVNDVSSTSGDQVVRDTTSSGKKVDAESSLDLTRKNDNDSLASADSVVGDATGSTKQVDTEPAVGSTKKADEEFSTSINRAIGDTADSTKKVEVEPINSAEKKDEVVMVTAKADDDSMNLTKKIDDESTTSTDKVDDEAKDSTEKGSNQSTNLTKVEERETTKETKEADDTTVPKKKLGEEATGLTDKLGEEGQPIT